MQKWLVGSTALVQQAFMDKIVNLVRLPQLQTTYHEHFLQFFKTTLCFSQAFIWNNIFYHKNQAKCSGLFSACIEEANTRSWSSPLGFTPGQPFYYNDFDAAYNCMEMSGLDILPGGKVRISAVTLVHKFQNVYIFDIYSSL